MRFEKLTHLQLKILKNKGFNILTSNNALTDEKVIWFPERVEDVCEFLISMDIKGITPFEEPNILVIQDAIDNINNEDLIGEIFI